MTNDDYRRAVSSALAALAADNWKSNTIARDDFPDDTAYLFFKRSGYSCVSYDDVLRADPCSFCRRPGSGGTIDHIVPRSAGGKNNWRNLTGACDYCNRLKSSVSVLDFLVARRVGVKPRHNQPVGPPVPPRRLRQEHPPVPRMKTPLSDVVWNRIP